VIVDKILVRIVSRYCTPGIFQTCKVPFLFSESGGPGPRASGRVVNGEWMEQEHEAAKGNEISICGEDRGFIGVWLVIEGPLRIFSGAATPPLELGACLFFFFRLSG
jgi:hypothetical protein